MKQYDPLQNNARCVDNNIAASLQAQEHETLGNLVQEILASGKTLSRKTLCIALLARLDNCEDLLMKQHYENIFPLLLGRKDS